MDPNMSSIGKFNCIADKIQQALAKTYYIGVNIVWDRAVKNNFKSEPLFRGLGMHHCIDIYQDFL